ncbi:MAG: hypothetical protein PHU85_17730 [Phycisphaerae bacterium]|nr:hypothetical protein [Phycisphaerae bacterium]
MSSIYERWLRLVLVLSGVVMLLAFAAMVMPASWMAATHRWLGLGPFPEGPIAEYLARLTSGLYGLLGILLLLAASDVRRYWVLARVLALGIVGISLAGWLLARGRMPVWWLMGDLGSAGVMAVAVLVLQWLAGRAPGERSDAGGVQH